MKNLLRTLCMCALVLALCALPAFAAQGEETRMVTHMKGETEIPLHPQRLIDVSGSAEELSILGIPYIACAQTSMFDGVTIPEHLAEEFAASNVEIVGNYAGIMDLNLEKIAELQPDLIIMNIRHEKVYEQLSQIAPTVMLSDDMMFIDWRGRFEELGAWFDKSGVVEQWLADFDAKAAELSAQVGEIAEGETFAVVEANSVHFGSFYIYREAGPGDIVHNELKLLPSAGVPEDIWGEVVDIEALAAIDADHIFYFSDDGTEGELAENAVWKNLKAVQEGNVHIGLNETQYNMAYTPIGKLLYMQMMAEAVLSSGDIPSYESFMAREATEE